MRTFQDLGVQRKMQIMTLLICGAVLLVAIVALFTFQVLTFRSTFQRDAVTLANVIANNSAVPMAFGDEQPASEVLASLKAKPTVIAASLVLPNDSLFAHFGEADTVQMRSLFPPAGESKFVQGELLLSEPVILKTDRVGTLYVRLDYQKTYSELLRFYSKVVGSVILVAAALGVLLSSRLSRTLTDPILQLAQTAQIVGDKNDYSVRAKVEPRGDELGVLTNSFNQMLSRVQSQDAALSLSQQKMEALIHSIDGIVWERAPETFQFTFVSRQSESLLGYAPQQWLDQPDLWTRKLHSEDAARAVESFGDFVRHREPYSFEYRMIAEDNRVVWIRESGVVLVENGKPFAIRGILQDITRQKKDAEQLDKLNRQLMDASRHAGMAEVATGVLHNVGNVLNSVSVAATVVGERLRRSKLPKLVQAATMLRQQNGHLVDFLTADPKGMVLPEYLATVSEQMAEEQERLVSKMESVARNIEHIKQIVAMQQSYAKGAGAYENLSPAELVEDALRINLAAFERHSVRVLREIEPGLPAVCVDRHKVLQILINLFRNAKYAMEGMEQQKQLVIRVSRSAADRVQICVSDNGVGIPDTNLTRIFNHGFTTKKEGHGFGLHSGANAAKEMGGSLTASSEGTGKGATFTLELPIAASTPKAQAKT